MKSNHITSKKAFSFVEIMFVVAIIAFLTASWVNYFNGFIDSKRIETELFLINNNIELLNTKVKNQEIYDYEVNFSWSKEYVTYKLNQSIKKQNTILLIDKNTKTYTLSGGLSYTWTWEVKIYTDNKKIFEKILDQRNTFTWKMDSYQKYDIKSKFDIWEDLFWIFYLSEDNFTSSWVTTNFVEANTKIDKTGISSKNFLLKNINKNNMFYSWNILWDTNEVYLFFEKAWLEKSIKIRK